MDNLEFNIDAILERNKRVEADKAWETSAFRRMTIGVLTYITAVIFLWIIEAAFPFLSALIPTIAYFLSTITLPPLKRWWIARYFARNTGNLKDATSGKKCYNIAYGFSTTNRATE